jgi:hypothetical protein
MESDYLRAAAKADFQTVSISAKAVTGESLVHFEIRLSSCALAKS